MRSGEGNEFGVVNGSGGRGDADRAQRKFALPLHPEIVTVGSKPKSLRRPGQLILRDFRCEDTPQEREFTPGLFPGCQITFTY